MSFMFVTALCVTACAAGIVLSRKLPPKKRDLFLKSVLLLTSLGVAAYLGEVAFWVSDGLDETRLFDHWRRGLTMDPRPAWRVVLDLRREGVDAQPMTPPSIFLDQPLVSRRGPLLPLAGVSRATTVFCIETERYAIFEADEHGFNNPPGLYSSGTDVVLIGDSFAMGACVQPGETLADALRETEDRVLSLGAGGNGPLLELATLEEYAEALRPGVVLWTYFEGNDLADLRTERRSDLLLAYLSGRFFQDLRSRQEEVDGLLRSYLDAEYRSRTPEATLSRLASLSHLRLRIRELGRKKAPEPDDAGELLALFRAILEEVQRRVSSWGGRLYFVYLPEWSRYAVPGYRREDGVADMVSELGIPVIDARDVLSAQPDPLAFFASRRINTHYTAEGYALLARQISETLRPQGP